MVAHSGNEAAGIVLETLAQVARHLFPGRRRYFHQLLVVALHCAVTFVKGKDIAIVVGKHLDLDVVHVCQELFHKEVGIAKGSLGHGRGLEEGFLKLGLIADCKNAAAATAALSLEHDGQPYLVYELSGSLNIDCAVGPGDNGNAQASGHMTGLHLVAQKIDGLFRGADKDNAFPAAKGREAAVL